MEGKKLQADIDKERQLERQRIWCEISAVHHMEPVLEPLHESAACQPALTANEESCERVAVN